VNYPFKAEMPKLGPAGQSWPVVSFDMARRGEGISLKCKPLQIKLH